MDSNTLAHNTSAAPAYSGHDNLLAMREAIHYNQMLEYLLEDNLASCHHLLDIGSGLGDFMRRMTRNGHHVVGIEPDAAQREAACQAGQFCVGTIDQCMSDVYDGAYSLNVLEHIEDDVGALREWRRALRKDGLLLVYVPAFPVLYGAMDRAVGHYRRYTLDSLQKAVQAAGFEVLHGSYADSLGFLASLALRARGGDGLLSPAMVRFYDRIIFPVSRVLDIFLDRVVGKNVWVVAQASEGGGGNA
jgi:SAM-dependent methyltransferase